jgi:hypothetical protein
MVSFDTNKLKGAVGFTLETSAWGNRRKADISQVTTDADKTRMRLSKELVSAEEYEKIKSFFGELRAWVYLRTVPSFFRKGFQLAGLRAVGEIEERMKKAQSELAALVDAFIAVYPLKIDEAKVALGSQFNQADYPSADVLRQMFDIEWNWVNFTTPEELPAELREAEQAKMKKKFDDAGEQITEALRLGFQELIKHAAEKLQPSEDGKPRVWRDSMIGNIQEFIDTFQNRNITNDVELELLTAKAQEIMIGIDPKQLRKDEDVRKEARCSSSRRLEQSLDQIVDREEVSPLRLRTGCGGCTLWRQWNQQRRNENKRTQIMKRIICTTKSDFEALPKQFDEFTTIEIRFSERVVVVAWGNSNVVARGNSNVVARGNSNVEARGNSNVVAWDNSNVVARDNSNVEARDNSNVEAWGNSNVVAWGNSNVVAWGNSNVEAWDNSNVVARDNSNVEARDNSNVEAWDNSNVVAWGNSNVVARGNSNVVAWGNVGIHIHSEFSTVLLFSFAVAWLCGKGTKAKKKSKTATIIKPVRKSGTAGWLEAEAVKPEKAVVLFKRVSSDFKTQEHTNNETLWKIGETLTHPSWSPKDEECGRGKFHACSRPYFCDQFRSVSGDKYIAIEIERKDLYAWPNPDYPHKIAFRKGTVLYQCDKFGKEIKS